MAERPPRASHRAEPTGRTGGQFVAGLFRPRARSLVFLCGCVLASAVGASGAVAFWTGSGAGTSAASSATTVGVTLGAASVAGDLYPGGTAVVRAKATNSNPARVTVRGLAIDTTRGSQGLAIDPDHAGCPVGDLTFTSQTNGGAGWVVPPASNGDDGSAVIDMPDALALDPSAPDACQGAAVIVYLKSIGT